MNRRGVSLIEVLIGILIVTIASIGTLMYFAYAKGNIGKTGNRRAALERARQRLEQLMATNPDTLPAIDPGFSEDNQPLFWLSCSGNPCTWTPSLTQFKETNIQVDDLLTQDMETIVQWRNDPSAGTTTPDVLEFSVRVWFIPNSTTDDDFNRVHVRTLRTP
ncbi:MAG: type II secretion system protein [Candidatus Omnitrophica bacterium]|nr:type II secretion system protein [Candidatus Omnitrophota bacterium]